MCNTIESWAVIHVRAMHHDLKDKGAGSTAHIQSHSSGGPDRTGMTSVTCHQSTVECCRLNQAVDTEVYGRCADFSRENEHGLGLSIFGPDLLLVLQEPLPSTWVDHSKCTHGDPAPV